MYVRTCILLTGVLSNYYKKREDKCEIVSLRYFTILMIYGNLYQIVQADPMQLQLHPDF